MKPSTVQRRHRFRRETPDIFRKYLTNKLMVKNNAAIMEDLYQQIDHHGMEIVEIRKKILMFSGTTMTDLDIIKEKELRQQLIASLARLLKLRTSVMEFQQCYKTLNKGSTPNAQPNTSNYSSCSRKCNK